jgi:hypothetical protein
VGAPRFQLIGMPLLYNGVVKADGSIFKSPIGQLNVEHLVGHPRYSISFAASGWDLMIDDELHSPNVGIPVEH